MSKIYICKPEWDSNEYLKLIATYDLEYEKLPTSTKISCWLKDIFS